LGFIYKIKLKAIVLFFGASLVLANGKINCKV
jgi:hypothetical protein